MKIVFNEEEHCYAVDGDIAQISVTELLHKHNLAPNYSGVKSAVLKESADIGKKIHKDIENQINLADYEPETDCGRAFNEWRKAHIDGAIAEQMLALDYNGMVIAGTADLIGFTYDGVAFLGDHKVTSKLNKDYVTWQVNILDYMARKLSGQYINGRAWKWQGAKAFYCFHYDRKTGTMKVNKLDKIADAEIEKLFDAEFRSERYKPNKLVISKEDREGLIKAEDALLQMEMQYKQAKEDAELWREKLCAKFEQQGIDSWEYKGVKFTKVPSVDCVTVDSRVLKRDFPSIYTQCTKLTKKRAYIKVTHKNEDL